MKQPRDLTQKQFAAACQRHGFIPQGFLGYYDLGIPNCHCHVSALNAGDRRRNQLAYLLREKARAERRMQ